MSISSYLILGLLSLAGHAAAVGVVGTPTGFGTGTTGGGTATPAYPSDIAQLKLWLTDSTPRVIVLNKEYVYTLRSSWKPELIGYADSTLLEAKAQSLKLVCFSVFMPD